MKLNTYWICPNCEAENSLLLKHCEVCNAINPNCPEYAEYPTFPSRSTSTSKPRSKEPSHFCIYCGCPIVYPQKKCPNCGAKIIPPEMVIKSCKVTPKSVTLGNDCKIQWQGDFVQHVVIEGVEYTKKNIAIQPKYSQVLAVTFVGLDESTVTKEVNISVVVPQPDIKISAPEYANNGDKVEIKWDAKYVDKVTIGDKSFKSRDKVILKYKSDKTLCEILFHGIDGSVIPKIIKVRKALPANIESCNITPEYLNENQWITIMWKGTNVVEWRVNGKMASPSKTSRTISSTNDDIKVTFYGEDGKIVEKILTPKVFKIHFCTLEQPTIIDKESVKINWSAQYAKSVTIFGEQQTTTDKGTYIWKPNKIGISNCSVAFVGMNGSIATRDLQVRVLPEPEIKRFELEGDNIVWECVSMYGCTINGRRMETPQGVLKIDDKMISTGEVVLECWDLRGKHYTAELPPSIISFRARKQNLFRGQSSTLSWSTYGMNKVILNGVIQNNKGKVTMPITTNQLKLDCWDKDNKYYSRTIEFELSEPQILTFSATSNRVFMGEPVTITWATQGMKAINLQDTTGYHNRGTITLPITSPYLLLECWADDDTYYSRTINFEILPDPELTIHAEKTTLTQGKSTTIRWNCKNVQNVKLNNEDVTIRGHKTMTFDKVGKHRITLSAEDLAGKQVKSKIIKVTVNKKTTALAFIGLMFFSAIIPGFNIMMLFSYGNKEDSASKVAILFGILIDIFCISILPIIVGY